MVSAVGKLLQRVQGFVWGDGSKDSTVYLENHTLTVDVVGQGIPDPALLVRGLDARNAPTDLFRVGKDGAVSGGSSPLLDQATADDLYVNVAGAEAMTGPLTLGGIDVGAALAYGRMNLLTNPGVTNWQRGAGAFSVNSAFTADRWQIAVAGGSALSVTREAALVDQGSQYAAACAYTHVGSGALWQGIEDYWQLRAKTVTFTARVRAPVAGGARLRVNDSVNGFRDGPVSTTTGAYETLTVTAPIAAAATQVMVHVAFLASGTYQVGPCVLVVGTVAPAYAPLHPAEDLARCQRYYWEIGGLDPNEYVTLVQATAATSGIGVLRFPVEMVAAPTVTVSAPGDFEALSPTGVAQACTALAASVATRRDCRLVPTVGANLVAGNAAVLRAAGTLNARLRFEANLP